MEKAVIFRKNEHGEIVAVFPTMPGTNGPDSCVAYTQKDKKITVELAVMRKTRQASLIESLPLLQEVVHEGFYPLKICQRVKGYMNEERIKAAKPDNGTVAASTAKKPVVKAKTHRKRPNRWLEGLEGAAA